MGGVHLARFQLGRPSFDAAQGRIGQGHGPLAGISGPPHLLAREALHPTDASLASLAPLHLALQHFQGVKAVPLHHVEADDQRLVDLPAPGMFPIGPAPHHRQGRAGPEGYPHLPGRFVHPAGVLPAVGEVLVIENRHRPAHFSDDARDLLEEIAARQHLLSQPGHGVVPVLPDQQDPVHRQLVASQRQRRPDAFVDGYVELVGQLASHVPLVNLVDVERGDAGPGRNQAVVGGKSPQELVHDHAGVAVGEEGGDHGGDFRERLGALGRPRGCGARGIGRRFLLGGAGAGGPQQHKGRGQAEQEAAGSRNERG